jgi:hypothetical protein
MNTLVQTIECTTGTCGHMSHQLLTTTGLFILVAITTFAVIHYFVKD